MVGKVQLVDALDTRALKMVRAKLVEDLNNAHADLGSGTQVIREDAAATGMNCTRYVGKIDGLKLALERLRQTDDEINGRSPDAE